MSEPAPPPVARFLLRLVAPKRERDAIEGDLWEDYRDSVENFGVPPAQAGRAYWRSVLISVIPLVTLDVTPLRIPRVLLASLGAALAVSLASGAVGVGLDVLAHPSLGSEMQLIVHVLLVVMIAPMAGFLASWGADSDTLFAAVVASVLLVGPALMSLGEPGTGGDGPRWIWILLVPIGTMAGALVKSERDL